MSFYLCADVYHPTISHNGLLIFDPDEGGNVADGGQRWPNNGRDHPMDVEMLRNAGYQMGEVTAHEFGPGRERPDYSYLAGDITRAYSSKAGRVTRSMVALNTGDAAYPAAFVVFDRVRSTNPAFKKTWLLHTIQEPVLRRRGFTVARDEPPYGGRLFVETLLPAEAEITKIGGPGKEFWVGPLDRNFPPAGRSGPQPASEPGAWRVEVSPAAPALEDRFLHAMTVADAGTKARPPAQLVRAGKAAGARVLDWTVLFSDGGEALESVDIGLPSAGKVLICDAAPGGWDLESPGAAKPARLKATAEGGCLFFHAAAGSHRLARTPAGE